MKETLAQTRIVATGSLSTPSEPPVPAKPSSRVVYEGDGAVLDCIDAVRLVALPTHQLLGGDSITVLHGIRQEKIEALEVQKRRVNRIPRLGWRTVQVISSTEVQEAVMGAYQAGSTTNR